MAIYLNTNIPLQKLNKLFNTEYFIDKSMIIEKTNKLINTANSFLCITKPRRFGKSSIANMLGAYYSKESSSKDIFDKLNISSSYSYLAHLNNYNVISLSFVEIDNNCKTCREYIERLERLLIQDLIEIFPDIIIKKDYAIWDILNELGEKFIFIFDEWDYIFNNNLFVKEQNDFLTFLMKLLKDQPYVSFAYMTGILPIKKYSDGSALNMFDEYTMLQDELYGDYFGFNETEVKKLCINQHKVDFNEISDWYNGYINEYGDKIYNPRSVIKALQNGKCRSYWTNTGSMDAVYNYLKYNILDVREDVIKMVSGEEIDIIIAEEFRAGQEAPKTKEEIYSAMIILGFLSYYNGYLKIPNKELMKEFEKALRDESFGYVSDIIKNSKDILEATVSGDTSTVVEILHDIHNSEIPILMYNDENSLSCVITLASLSARDTYRVEREEKSGKGYADFTFHPRRRGDTAFVLELKKDSTVDNAINQIKDKEYFKKFIQEHEGREILAVAICYDSKNKEHSCKIEKLK